jgi:hypothetical protein
VFATLSPQAVARRRTRERFTALIVVQIFDLLPRRFLLALIF